MRGDDSFKFDILLQLLFNPQTNSDFCRTFHIRVQNGYRHQTMVEIIKYGSGLFIFSIALQAEKSEIKNSDHLPQIKIKIHRPHDNFIMPSF